MTTCKHARGKNPGSSHMNRARHGRGRDSCRTKIQIPNIWNEAERGPRKRSSCWREGGRKGSVRELDSGRERLGGCGKLEGQEGSQCNRYLQGGRCLRWTGTNVLKVVSSVV